MKTCFLWAILRYLLKFSYFLNWLLGFFFSQFALKNDFSTKASILQSNTIQKIDPALTLKYVDEDDKLVWWEWLTDKRRWALFPAGAIIECSHHLRTPTRRVLSLKLRRAWVWTLLNGATWSTHYMSLRILTGKTYPPIKLKCLRKVGIWTFGHFLH